MQQVSEDKKGKPKENVVPRQVTKLENLFDLQDRFKRPTNCKTNSSSMKFEIVNLGTETNPQNINLGTCCTPTERGAYINLF